MNIQHLFKSILFISSLIFLAIACEQEANLCETVNCENGGICENGICSCPTGYTGTNCELIDVQALLDAGETPQSLYDEGVPLESLYGNTYLGGLIFYLNTSDGSGLVAAMADQSTGVDWSCYEGGFAGLDYVTTSPSNPETEVGARIGDGMTNTNVILAECMDSDIAAKRCRDLGTEWFLPSREELNSMYTNLHLNGYGDFATGYDFYWTSTAYGNSNAWAQSFDSDSQTSLPMSFIARARAVKGF